MADQILCGGQVFDSLFYSLGDDCETMRTSLILKINSALKKANEDANKVDSKTPLAQYEEGESTTALKVVKSAGIDPATGQEVFIKLNGERTFEYSADDKFVIGFYNSGFCLSLREQPPCQ